MNFNLEDSLQIAENLIRTKQANENDGNEEILIKLEATLKCFQHHILTLTRGVLQ